MADARGPPVRYARRTSSIAPGSSRTAWRARRGPTSRGTVEAGPNAVLAFKREGYGFSTVSFDDIVEYIEFPGFWKMATRHAKTGLFEMYRSLSKPAFVRSVQALIPEIRAEDLVVGRAGVRAQAVEPNGALVDDFRIAIGPSMLHVLNAPSPAATASLAIAKHIVRETLRVFRV